MTYINNQAEHHRKRSFREEFVAMLAKHDFAYEESMYDRRKRGASFHSEMLKFATFKNATFAN